ncbi:7544_t:CDS:2, partial [Gigaspora rosea]
MYYLMNFLRHFNKRVYKLKVLSLPNSRTNSFDKENLQEKLKEVHTYRRNSQNILHKEQQKKHLDSNLCFSNSNDIYQSASFKFENETTIVSFKKNARTISIVFEPEEFVQARKHPPPSEPSSIAADSSSEQEIPRIKNIPYSIYDNDD